MNLNSRFYCLVLGCLAAIVIGSSARTLPPAAMVKWNAHVKSVQTLLGSVQPKCVPTILYPSASIATKGVVILYPGFTSCWQQHETFASILQEKGYIVLMPTPPGIGMQNPTPSNPEHKHVPTSSGPYKAFVDEMFEITEIIRVQGKHQIHIAGLSLGGAMGLYHFSRNIEHQRALLFAPFVGVGLPARGKQALGSLLLWIDRGIRGAANWVEATPPITFNKDVPWGSCEEDRKAGRAGICTILRSHFLGAIQFADFARSTFKTAARRHSDLTRKLLLVPVQGDKTVNSPATIKLANEVKAALWEIPSPQVGRDSNNQEITAAVSHSVLSPYGYSKAEGDWYRCEVHYNAWNFLENQVVPPKGLRSRPPQRNRFVPRGFNCKA